MLSIPRTRGSFDDDSSRDAFLPNILLDCRRIGIMPAKLDVPSNRLRTVDPRKQRATTFATQEEGRKRAVINARGV